MAPLGENFWGYKDSGICPLCKDDLDSQNHSFQCQVMKERVEIDCNMDTITQETAEKVRKMLKIRRDLLGEIEKKSKETFETQEAS